MARTNLLRLVFCVALIIAVFHTFSLFFLLYGFYWWLDIPPHLLGGLCVGLFSLWLFCTGKGHVYPISSLRVLFTALASVLVVGVAWEIFEYYAGIAYNPMNNYWLDTFKDLTMDVVGGYLAHLYFLLKGYHCGV